MLRFDVNLRQQALVILGSSSEVATPGILPDYPYTKQLSSSAPKAANVIPNPEGRILRKTRSNVPGTWETGLGQEYQELGEALSEMTELQEGDEWKIDAAVYDAARRVAAGLMAKAYPAPQVFSHGPKSVVFNWSYGANNLYVTISANRISALSSSPERINRRLELSPSELMNQSLVLPSARADRPEHPVVLLLTGAVPDPPWLFG